MTTLNNPSAYLPKRSRQPHAHEASGLHKGAAEKGRKRPTRFDRLPPPWALASRRIMTRSQRKVFPFLQLPRELRDEIYKLVAKRDGPISMQVFGLGRSLAVNRQIKEEGLPFFFSVNTFTIQVHCKFNTCQPFHDRPCQGSMFPLDGICFDHILFRRLHLNQLDKNQVVRFRHVKFEALWSSCLRFPMPHATIIPKVELFIANRQPTMEFTCVSDQRYLWVADENRKCFVSSKKAAESFIEQLKQRPVFNGYTMEDLTVFGSCFSKRNEPRILERRPETARQADRHAKTRAHELRRRRSGWLSLSRKTGVSRVQSIVLVPAAAYIC